MRHVFLIEDHPLFRTALRDLLLRTHPHCVIDEAADWRTGRARLAVFGQGYSRLIVSDVRLPDISGPQWLLELRDLMRQDDVLIVLSGDDDTASRQVAQAAGAKAILQKTTEISQLLAVLAGSLDPVPVGPPQPPLSRALQLFDLSPRQRLVARALLRGMANKEIARELQVGTETVKSHVSEIIARLGVRNRTEAVLELARRAGPELAGEPLLSKNVIESLARSPNVRAVDSAPEAPFDSGRGDT